MWNKLYLAALGLSITVMAFFTHYSWSWLQSVGVPRTALDSYAYYNHLGLITLLISSTLLIILGNVILWLSRNAWALWITFIYFGLFVLLKGFWLTQAMLHYSDTNGSKIFDVEESSRIISILLTLLAGVFVFFDQYIVLKLQRKMYPVAITVDPVEPESGHSKQ